MKNKNRDNKINEYWKSLFEQYDIHNIISNKGFFVIKAKDIRKYHEPRLMTKFDTKNQLPSSFFYNPEDDNAYYSILPISRSEYIILPFNAYCQFPKTEGNMHSLLMDQENKYQTLDLNKINTEQVALSVAYNYGFIDSFIDEDWEKLSTTISGRMTTSFNCSVNLYSGERKDLIIKNSQIEIDAVYESPNNIVIIEAKNRIFDDFLIRQLYYPYRHIHGMEYVSKPIRNVYLAYSNYTFYLYEYAFKDINNYNSLQLVKSERYVLTDKDIELEDILNVFNSIDKFVDEDYKITFPQANTLKTIISIMEQTAKNNKKTTLPELQNFDIRQANYYVTAGQYLGLFEDNKKGEFALTLKAKKILKLRYRERQLKLVECILEHKIFYIVFEYTIKSGNTNLKIDEILGIIKNEMSYYHNLNDTTKKRRCSTIKAWIDWIFNLVNKE